MTYPYTPYWQYPNYLNALQQNYANQIQQQATQQNPIRVILVSNEDEAKATPADSTGNPTFFYNKSMNKIYLKQINPQTGAAPLQVFNAEITNESTNEINPYKKDFNTIIEGINGLYRILSPMYSSQQSGHITTQPPILTEEPEESIKPKKGGK